VILSDRGWVYVLPRHDQWETVYSIELATGVQQSNGTIYAGSVGRLHPSGDYLYLADRGLSPSDFEKFDVRTGPAMAMYDSPYHGDYAFSGDLWFFEDGSRVIARSANVFRTSPVRAEDMTYAGKLSGLSFVQFATTSSETKRVYAATGTLGGDMFVFDTDFLALRSRVPTPNFSGTVRSSAMFVFASENGTRLYTLVRADPGSGLANDWAFVVMDTAGMN
jgi:hypothetical protein